MTFSGEAVVWQGSGTVWPGVAWGEPLATVLGTLGWRVSLVPWGDPAAEHRGRDGVLHVFSGGLEAIGSGSAAMAERLDAVRAALDVAADDRASVVGICLGAQMIAAVAGQLDPEPVPSGGEAGTTTVHGHGVPDLHVATAHAQQVPTAFLGTPGTRLLWSNAVTPVQGFTLGSRVAGVQFHPELCPLEAGWAAAAFQELLGVPDAEPARGDLDPVTATGTVLAMAGAHRRIRSLAA